MVHLFFGFDGRISRSPFWIGLLFVIVVAIAAMLALGLPFFPTEMEPFPARAQEFVIQLIALYPAAAILVKRLHDRDYPGKYAAWLLGLMLVALITDLLGLTGDPNNITWIDLTLGCLLIVIGLAFLIDLGFRRGTAGENQYGADPLDGGAAGQHGS